MNFKTFVAYSLLSLMLPTTISAQGMSYKNLNACDEYPQDLFSSAANSILQLKELPQGLYLVRTVSQSLESSTGEKYFSYQKLLTKEESHKRLCYHGNPKGEFRVQTYFPTIIDRTKQQKYGHVFWSLSVATLNATGAIEANRSLIPGVDYKTKLEEQGFKIEERQKSHHEYELKLERNVASWKETIVLLYDQY